MIDDLLLKVKNRKLVMLLAPVLAGLLFGGMMVVKPSLSRISAIQTQRSDLAKKESVFNDILQQEKKLIGYRQRLSKIVDRAKFIDNLNALAGKSGLTVLSMVPEEKTVMATYLERVVVRIEMEGNYHQLGEFVSSVENLEQFAKIILVDIDTEFALLDDSRVLNTGLPLRPRSSQSNTYKISIAVGLFYPVKDVF